LFANTINDTGVGCTPDVEKAIELYERAYEAGSGDACNELGFLYDAGSLNIPRDEELACTFYQFLSLFARPPSHLLRS
jgi:TPR repeat protein